MTDKTLTLAADIQQAFGDAGVLADFNKMPYSHRKEYLLWIEDAKKPETRKNRIEKAIEKLLSKS